MAHSGVNATAVAALALALAETCGAEALQNPFALILGHGGADAALVDRVLPIGGETKRSAGGDCEPHWIPMLGPRPGLANVDVMAVYDSGNGPELYVGGSYNTVEPYLMRWDGSSWSDVGGDVDGPVEAMIVHDDGGGPALFVGGQFQHAGATYAPNIARWDGSAWSAVGFAGLAGEVECFAIYNDGAGAALYAGGGFPNGIARWNGSTWSTLGSGMNGDVNDLATWNEGSGTKLYATGSFTTAGGTPANQIARWNGTSWSALGTGLNESGFTLAVYSGVLYVGGAFTSAGGVSANHIARYSFSTWSALGSGTDDRVFDLFVYNDGNGSSLFAGGTFNTAGGAPAGGIARYNGTSWSPVGTGTNGSVSALRSFNRGDGVALYAGGVFTSAGGAGAIDIARWDGTTWTAAGAGMTHPVRCFTVHDDGSGPALYVGGDFDAAGGLASAAVGRWDGTTWSSLQGPNMPEVNEKVFAMATFDDGIGPNPALYAGGVISNVLRWDGSSWSEPGAEQNLPPSAGIVRALLAHDDGSGPALYVGGHVLSVPPTTLGRIWRWDGVNWSLFASATGSGVNALAEYDDGSGSGPALYVGGPVGTLAGVPVGNIARWDGSAWSALGSGASGTVRAMTVHDDGGSAGIALYVGGDFSTAGGVLSPGVARWDGSNWSAVGSGLDYNVHSLTLHDDGSGAVLHAGNEVAIWRWDGSTWSMVAEVGDVVNALASFGGAQASLYVGGDFMNSPAGDSFFARFGCAPNPADVNGDGTVGFADLTEILLDWGACPEPCSSATCPSDVDENCDVGFSDLTTVLLSWG